MLGWQSNDRGNQSSVSTPDIHYVKQTLNCSAYKVLVRSPVNTGSQKSNFAKTTATNSRVHHSKSARTIWLYHAKWST